MKVHWKTLLICIAIPLAIGAISGLLTKNSAAIYTTLTLPPFAPPGWLFPIVWTILYFLMGVSCYLIATSSNPAKKDALRVYAFQLFLNFLWNPVFFNLQNYLLAFFILIILLYCILEMILAFRPINKTAAILQIPYFLWVIFAGYLNLTIYFLN